MSSRVLQLPFWLFICVITGNLWLEAQPERAIRLERALYLFEVRGETAEALEIVREMGADSSENALLELRRLLLELKCHLVLEDDDNARDCYQRLYEMSGDFPRIIDAANRLVPSGYIHREVPWTSGSYRVFVVHNSEGETKGVALLSIREDSKGSGGAIRRILRGVEIGQEYREYQVELDFNSLSVVGSQLFRSPLSLIERKWLSFEEPEESSLVDNVPYGWTLRNAMLQQLPLELGLESRLSLFDVTSGIEDELASNVSSIEMIRTGEDVRQPGMVTDVLTGDGMVLESHVFSNDATKEAIEYRFGGSRAHRLSELHSIDNKGEWTSIPFATEGAELIHGPFLDMGVRVYAIAQSLKTEVEAEGLGRFERVEVKVLEPNSEGLSVCSLFNGSTGEFLGLQFSVTRWNKQLVVFGSKRVLNHTLNPDLMERFYRLLGGINGSQL